MKKTLTLVDISSYVFRAYYAIRPLQTSKGIPTNATYGVITMLLRLIREKKPDHLVIVFDSPVPSFRKEIYDKYKANREAPPEDLPAQFEHIKDFVARYPLPSLQVDRYEADDLIATVVKKIKQSKQGGERILSSVTPNRRLPSSVNTADGLSPGAHSEAAPLRGWGPPTSATHSPTSALDFEDIEVIIVTGDKDLMQLVTDDVHLYDSMKERDIGPDQVREKFGVNPDQVVDVLALSGDASDNIPGIDGIGPKTATKLIQQWGNLEKVLANADKIPGQLGQKIRHSKEAALLSRKLVILRDDVPLESDWKCFELKPPDQEKLNELYRELELTSLVQKMDDDVGAGFKPAPTIQSEPGRGGVTPPANADKHGRGDLAPTREKTYDLILTEADLQKWVARLKNSPNGFAFDTETTGLNPLKVHLVGMSFSDAYGEGCYIPVGHSYLGCPQQLLKETVLKAVKPLLEDSTIPKWTQNGKYDMEVYWSEGITVQGLAGDTLVASYLVNPEGRHNLDHLAREYLQTDTVLYEEVVPKGRTFADVELEKARDYAAEDAEVTMGLVGKLHEALRRENLWECYQKLEVPLIGVLFRMECCGVRVDTAELKKLSAEFKGRLQKLEKDIFENAGVEFNVASPKQVGEILFVKLRLPPQRKTKTGFSTDVDVLQALSKLHPLPQLLLEHRLLSKLVSTYVDQLQTLVHPKTGRIHTSYNQTIAATGRLSSSDPNLQNIPIRSEEGRRIRAAFNAPKGWKIVSADYSQIELRLLAAFSEDPHLTAAFKNDEDVHRMTAEKIFGKSKGQVTPELRARAKTVNFGIMYGQSPFGLSQLLEIPQGEAKKYIEGFYNQFPSVRAYKEKVLAQARQTGEVRTWQGRRRLVPELNSKNTGLRNNAERTAFNTIFQGSAADLIKLAMIRIDAELLRRKSKARMVIQVHDELVFEVPEGEIKRVSELVRHEMENAVSCKVPLKVDIGVGSNWAEAH